MVKLTPDILSSKLGKKVDFLTIKEIDLSSSGFSEVSTFSRLKVLEVLDLSSNRFQLIRHIKGLFDLPRIRELKLNGNPVCKVSQYRLTVIANLPTLKLLDGIEITEDEIEQSKSISKEIKDPLLNTPSNDDVDEPNIKEPEPPKPQKQEPPKQQQLFKEEPKDQIKEKQPKEEQVKVKEQPKEQPKKVEVVQQPKPQPTTNVDNVEKQIKKKLVIDEDDLFAPQQKKNLVFEKEDSLFDDKVDEDLSKFEKKSKPITTKKSPIVFNDDDDDEDELFGKGSRQTKKPVGKVDLDDDLFSSFDKKESIHNEFDVSSYIESQKNRKKSSLFD